MLRAERIGRCRIRQRDERFQGVGPAPVSGQVSDSGLMIDCLEGLCQHDGGQLVGMFCML